MPRYARMVPFDEIADPKNDFNLNLPRYIDCTEPEDLQDIDGHLRGGIPERDLDALAAYWQVLPAVRAALFESAGRPGYARLKLPITEVNDHRLRLTVRHCARGDHHVVGRRAHGPRSRRGTGHASGHDLSTHPGRFLQDN